MRCRHLADAAIAVGSDFSRLSAVMEKLILLLILVSGDVISVTSAAGNGSATRSSYQETLAPPPPVASSAGYATSGRATQSPRLPRPMRPAGKTIGILQGRHFLLIF
jgi:hypothetical protein